MVVQHNLTAMNANRYLGINNSKLSKSLEKLSSGYQINRAGDNAAGLAVSEKMRSQIAGMTQGVKNAQDGISMVQTFEGALTETDSILQRMKVLADQSANGTYQDDVDREAIQLEFDQLNDELNQIADTDFNGVIALNGGVMADGLKQVGNKFDYENAESQAAAEKAAKLAELNAQKAALSASTPVDIANTSSIWGSLDDSGYQADEAAQLWDDLKLDADKVSHVDVTYTATVKDDGTIEYTATSGVDSNGTALDDTQLGNFATTAVNDANSAASTGAGGFTASAGATDNVNVIFDATKIKTGDVVTIRYTGPGSSKKAPTNIGFANDSLDFAGGVDNDETKYAVTIGKIEDDEMTDDIMKAFDAWSGVDITVSVANGAKGPNNNAAVTLGTTALTNGTGKMTIGGADFSVDTTTTSGKIVVSAWDADSNAAGKELFTIDMTGVADATAAGTVKFQLAIDSYSVPGAATIDAEPVKSDLGEEIAANQAKIDAIDAEIAALDEDGVSVSNAYGKAAIPLTYTSTITLQAGARSKDAVEFTFKYNKSKGMGKLESNMDCSAREGGLNTASLSLSTAEDANAAIDQIDHAINKVSMVRATFGAIQNRLEHKIDNLNVSIENLTSAESQIRDTDMPTEMMNFTKQQILAQASQSMLAQANQLPQSVLSLLQ